jgi:uncharacterized membrane protein
MKYRRVRGIALQLVGIFLLFTAASAMAQVPSGENGPSPEGAGVIDSGPDSWFI